jgi:hypothetical protein
MLTLGLLVCSLASEATAIDRFVPTDGNLAGVMSAADDGDVVIIESDGPHNIPVAVNWARSITVKPAEGVSPTFTSDSRVFLQPLEGAEGTKFGDKTLGTITLDAGGERPGVISAEDPPNPAGPMRNLIDLQHAPGDPIVFENVHIVNPGSNNDPGTGIRAFIVQKLSGQSGGNYTIDNCLVDFRNVNSLGILLDQDCENITIRNSTLLASGSIGSMTMIKFDGKQETQNPPVAGGQEGRILPMNLDIDDSLIAGPNSTVDFMQGSVIATVDNSCLRSLGGLQNAALSARNNGNLDAANMTVNDSVLISEGTFAAIAIRGQDPRVLTVDHCDVYCTNGDGILIRGSLDGTFTANVTNCNISTLSGFNVGLNSDSDSGESLNADFNNVFVNGGTDYGPEWNVTNDVAAGDPIYVDIVPDINLLPSDTRDCDATYLNGALETADSTGGHLGHDGPGMIETSLQLPGDCNQDGDFDLSDVICLLGHLFQGNPENLPCSTDAANLGLMDCNMDDGVDLSDAIYKLAFLFQGGSPPVAGTVCISIANCPDNTGCQ